MFVYFNRLTKCIPIDLISIQFGLCWQYVYHISAGHLTENTGSVWLTEKRQFPPLTKTTETKHTLHFFFF